MKSKDNFLRSLLFLVLGGLVVTLPVAAKPVIGIVLPNDESRWTQDAQRFSAALTDAGFEYEVRFSQSDTATEASNVDEVVALGIKVLILCPIDSEAAAAEAETARAAGVKVIAYDRLITGTTAVNRFVTFDSTEVGRAQGEFLVGRAQGKGNPLYLFAGAGGDHNSRLFFDGAWRVLQPKFVDGTFAIQNSPAAVRLKAKASLTPDEIDSVFDSISTNWNPDEASELARAALRAPGVRKGAVFVLAPNDSTARALFEAFRDDPSVKGVTITGQDAERDSVQSILDGNQTMTVLKDVRTLVDQALTEAISLVSGIKPATSKTYDNGAGPVASAPVPTVVVTRENAKQVVFESGYYDPSEFSGVE